MSYAGIQIFIFLYSSIHALRQVQEGFHCQNLANQPLPDLPSRLASPHLVDFCEEEVNGTPNFIRRTGAKSSEVYTVHELIQQLARTISCGGNFLLNVGPDMHGKIPPIFEDRLRELGRFINAHSEAVYGTKPWIHQNDTGNTWYTSSVRSIGFPSRRLFNPQIEGETTVYAWILNMPTKDLELKQIKTTESTKVTFLGTDVSFKPGAKSSLIINFERIPWRHLVRNDVMVLKIENAASQMRVPHKGDHHAKSRTRAMNFADFQWTYDAF